MPTTTITSGTTVVSTTLPVSSGFIVKGSGTLDIVNGGTVSGLISVKSGGEVVVSSGGTELKTIIGSGGTVNLLSGGSFSFAGVESGGKLNVAGTVTSDVTVFAGGVETVSSGGVVSGQPGSGTLISGTVNVLSGGTFTFGLLSNGGKLNVLPPQRFI